MDKLKTDSLLSEIQEKVIKLSREVLVLMDDLNDLYDAVNLEQTEWKGKGR